MKCHFLPLSNTRDQRRCGHSPQGSVPDLPPCLQARPAVGPSLLSPEGLILSEEHPLPGAASLKGLQFGAASLIPQLSPGPAVAPLALRPGALGLPLSFTDTGPGKRKYLLRVTATAIADIY